MQPINISRRRILQYGIWLALGGLAACSRNSQTQQMPGGAHQGHDMRNAMHGTPASAGSAPAGATALMPPEAMPAGAALSALPLLANRSARSAHFQAELTAQVTHTVLAGGKTTEIWAYNGQLPGPQIVVQEGDTMEIHFRNALPQPTTIHWHGLDVPAQADGNPQDPVPPGGQRVYRFTLPEGSAGTYWYHPHPHKHVSEQVYRGLAGTLIVRAKDDPLAGRPEQHWLISDLRLAADGSIPPNTPTDWMNGREGEFVLINGQYRPDIRVQGNERIRIWNATSARYLRLQIPGISWIVVGSDGGLLEQPLPAVSELFLAPAERVEVILQGTAPTRAALHSLYYDRQKMMVQETPSTLTLAHVRFAGEQADIPPKLRTLPPWGDIQAQQTVVFSEVMNMMNQSGMNHGSMNHGTATGTVGADTPPPMMTGMFLVNGKTFDMKRIDLRTRAGQSEEWMLQNLSHMDHPFHLHGTQFEIIRREWQGKRENAAYRALKDTVNLRPNETVWIRTRQNQPGLRMFHCHILEHENLGMMGILEAKA